jgi:hypothetical protein
MTTALEEILFLIELQISETNMFGSKNNKKCPLFIKINLKSHIPNQNLKIVTTEYLKNVKILDPIGMGGFGLVNLIEIEGGKRMAMKRMGIPVSDDNDYKLYKDKIDSFYKECTVIR